MKSRTITEKKNRAKAARGIRQAVRFSPGSSLGAANTVHRESWPVVVSKKVSGGKAEGLRAGPWSGGAGPYSAAQHWAQRRQPRGCFKRGLGGDVPQLRGNCRKLFGKAWGRRGGVAGPKGR
ncbi:unnamed protein product [Calypogeia fissa]